jgi:hypothetical protein
MATDHPEGQYVWRHGLLCYKGKVIVPDDGILKTRLLHKMHDTKTGEHSAFYTHLKIRTTILLGRDA